jgi:hypothetical protein
MINIKSAEKSALFYFYESSIELYNSFSPKSVLFNCFYLLKKLRLTYTFSIVRFINKC